MNRQQFRVLYRNFLMRIIDIELLSLNGQGDAGRLVGQFISLLIFLSLLFSLPALYFDGKLAVPGQEFLITVWTLQHFLIATTMLLVGLFAVLTWNSVFPDKRDVMIVGPLPVRTRTVFIAKVAAIATALGLLVIVLHALPGIVWPLAFNRYVPAQILPDLAAQPAIPPVRAQEMKAVMARDLEPLRRSGALLHGGVSIGVMTGSVRQVFSYGAARPDSIYEIGSVTKTFTGLLLAQMAQQGKVTLDEPVRELMPPGAVEKPRGPEITLLDLATHHSGLPRMPNGFYQMDKDNPFADFHATDLYDYLARTGVKRPADVSFLYSNLGLGLLGQVLADHAHTSYAHLVKTEVTDPLGLKDTVVTLSPDQRRRLIQGYNGFSDGPDGFRRASHAYGDPVPPTDFDAIAGAGALHSTAGDLLRFLEENLHPKTLGGSLAAALEESRRLRADMTDSAFEAEYIPPGTRIALTWFRTPEGCYLHGGAMPGYSAAVLFYPEHDWAVAVLSNTGPGGLLSSDLIADHIRQRLEGLPTVSLAPVNIPASGGFLGWIRLFTSYWITIFAASAFIYCSILGLQGMAASLLPRRWFLRAASFLQIATFGALLSVYFLQPIIAQPNLLDVHSTGLPDWSPSYWFLGLLQQLNGSPGLSSLARRAWIGLSIAVATTAATYTLCYLRTLRRIVEEPDILPGRARELWLPRFGQSFETAVVQFSIRTLLRSRQHRLILAFYLGVGFGATVFLLKSPVAKQLTRMTVIQPWHESGVPLLAASIILMGFWTIGVRAVFALPIELHANWTFRVLPVRAGSRCVTAMRLSLLTLGVGPAWFFSAMVFVASWPLRPATEHLILLALVGVTIAELSLLGSHKIPFTCAWLPGKSNFHITFWICILLILEVILQMAELERRALENPRWCAGIALVLAVIVGALSRWNSRSGDPGTEILQFEEVLSGQLTTLDLPR